MNKVKSEKASVPFFRYSLMILYDVFAVNISYFLALLIRCYVRFDFEMASEKYIPLYLKIAPLYTILCIIIFVVFRLYSSMWKYAGLNDLNRILIASLLTSVIQVSGTLMFVGKMPAFYYVVGGILQLILIVASRFFYRIWKTEKEIIAFKRADAQNVMIIGASEIGRKAIKYLESDPSYAVRPVCVVDTWENQTGRMMEGIPVIGGIAKVENAIEHYSIRQIIFADPLLSSDDRKEINRIAQFKGIELQNFAATFLVPQGQQTADKAELEKANEHFRSLHHIAIIVSAEESIRFYEKLGFREIDRMDRGYDIIVMMEGPCLLEIYIDPTHPARVNRPEALGLRHLALKVEDLQKTVDDLDIEVEPIRETGGKHFTYLKDPDGLPIELHE